VRLHALLAELTPARAGRIVGDAATTVTGMTLDSGCVELSTLFACTRGARYDGHDFAPAAVAAGASALLVDHELDLPVAQLVVDDVRLAMGAVAAAVHDHPSRAMTLVGITGTNGKTTTCHLLASIMREAGMPTKVIGTLSGLHTTPEAPDLQAQLAEARRAGIEAVAMEVSSHAMAMHRADGTWFAAAVFTNLGTDHLDLHGTVEEYFRAKASLFTPDMAAVGVSNVDDAHGRLLLDAAEIDMVPYSVSDITDLEVAANRHAYTWHGRRIAVGLGGDFNVSNSLAAATAASVLGIGDDDIVSGLAGSEPVPGRFELITGTDDQPTVVVDYAHTPDGLEQVISAARRVAAGRVLVVFGAGGDRDHGKRPAMGAVAAALADRVVVTSDNPRSEDPAAILSAVVGGVAAADRERVVVEPDRRAAIAAALAEAGAGDVVVVAGKGHETTQTIGDRVLPFDDRAVVRELLA
jgi:UDP-N-acetylmuramoyl-L-alanyl-D-glutamate--2,6-diaminopimelate ligase